jgi:ABC-type uncharacterized transport system ATPase subunit
VSAQRLGQVRIAWDAHCSLGLAVGSVSVSMALVARTEVAMAIGPCGASKAAPGAIDMVGGSTRPSESAGKAARSIMEGRIREVRLKYMFSSHPGAMTVLYK